MSDASAPRKLNRDTNQALGIGQYAIDFLRDGAPSATVLERTSLFFTDAVLCGASALALCTNDGGIALGQLAIASKRRDLICV